VIWLLRNKSVVTKGIGLSEVAGPLHLQWHGQSTRDGTISKGKIQCYMGTGVGDGVRLGCEYPIRQNFWGHANTTWNLTRVQGI